MGISERERQVLDSIERELAQHDQQLASMLMMFSRLTADERMPAREPVRSVDGEPGWRRAWRFRIGRQTRGWLLLAAAAALLVSMVFMTRGNRVSVCTHSLTAREQAPAGF